jgi:hypothetical protein
VLDFVDPDDSTVKGHWAVLVAGSAGWGNYRHQADVCHAYQVLVAGGLKPERIIVLMYDDIAHHTENPHKGTIVNSPGARATQRRPACMPPKRRAEAQPRPCPPAGGPDVYAGVPKDYTGDNVTSKTLLAVLAGDSEAVRGRGSGRVLQAGPADRVFLFYSDHGSAGELPPGAVCPPPGRRALCAGRSRLPWGAAPPPACARRWLAPCPRPARAAQPRLSPGPPPPAPRRRAGHARRPLPVRGRAAVHAARAPRRRRLPRAGCVHRGVRERLHV